MTGQAADVIVVGGGIMGAATAFFLARRGRSVILLERDLVGQHASGVNFGNVRRQGRFLPQLPLANRSRDIWGRLPELLGEDAEFLPSGHIRVAFTRDDAAALERHAEDVKPYGLDLEILSGNALRARFPFLSTQAVAGSFSPRDGHANPRLAAPAFARAARRLGVTVLEGAEVVGIEKSGEDFSVETRGAGTFRAPALQISAGAWAGALAARFGEPVPIEARGPQMGVTEPMPYAVAPVLGISSMVAEEGVYMRQVERGNIVFGGGLRVAASLETRRAHVDPRNTMRQMPYLRRLLPGLGRLQVIRTWSGVEGYVGDGLPVIGPSAKVAGLFYAFGFCGHGFQLGPGVGDAMAEMIDRGQSSTPLAPFAVSRFEGHAA
jgi:sarcosine oxidase subunit beta